MRDAALGLLSGGLDSMTATAMLARIGLRPECVHFETGFGRAAYRRSIERLTAAEEWPPVHVMDVREEFFEKVLTNPRFGYGSAMNPCIDCRIFMLRRASDLARRRGIDLLFTGEIVGQRSMGQSRAALERIEREAGVDGRLLRPLCAALMPPTAVERQGRIDRSRLEKIHGSSRRRQFALAHQLGLDDFPQPAAGCCFLAERGFAARLRDELSHRSGGPLQPEEIALLEIGRQFRISWSLKAILGRNQAESIRLKEHQGDRRSVQVSDGRGSFGLLIGDGDQASYRTAASLAARYSRRRGEAKVEVLLRREGERERFDVSPASDEDLENWRL